MRSKKANVLLAVLAIGIIFFVMGISKGIFLTVIGLFLMLIFFIFLIRESKREKRR